MPNFYKILSKTYKLTGYSKYKLGYVKIKNLLTTEPINKAIAKPIKKAIRIDEPLQG